MTLVLQLTPELEVRLNELAEREGKRPETIALEAIDEKLKRFRKPVAGSKKKQSRLAAFRALIASAPDGNPDADISRESIYE